MNTDRNTDALGNTGKFGCMNRNCGKRKAGEQFWFYIDTYVHISIKKDSLLLYNSLTGKALEYSGESEENRQIMNLVKKMRSPKNLQVILLKKKDLDDPVISQLVADVRRHFMGDLLDASFSYGKPFQPMPILTIRKDVKYQKKEDIRSVGENMMSYLTEVFLYINGDCRQNCHICIGAYKQFPCCTAAKSRNGELDILKIKELFGELAGSALTRLNILGGNIFNHTQLDELLETVNSVPAEKNIHAHYLNVLEAGEQLKMLKRLKPGTATLKTLVTVPIDEEKLKTVQDMVRECGIQPSFVFIIQDENEFEKAEAVISALNIADCEFQPFYNEADPDFFKENVFTDKEEILESKPELKDIYTNSLVNSLNFGRLTILSNGSIYANVNASRLGVLGRDSIYDVLYKEMFHGKSWRRVRKNVAPCKSCTFEALCPPLTNYTHAVGRNNLCHREIVQ